MISLLLVNNFHPMISCRRVEKKQKSTNYCIRFGHSLWSAQPVASARGYMKLTSQRVRRVENFQPVKLPVNHRWTIA